jgi:hypothetical protein
MILYINGDGHSAAAMASTDFVTAEDDVDLWYMGRAPHPVNLRRSYGAYIASVLKARLLVEADANNTNQTVIDQTKKFIENNPVNEQILVIAGLPVYDKLQFDEFGAYFKQRNIKHILYPVSDYIEWLTLRHHTPNEFGYFDELAHKDWAGNLIKPLTRII